MQRIKPNPRHDYNRLVEPRRDRVDARIIILRLTSLFPPAGIDRRSAVFRRVATRNIPGASWGRGQPGFVPKATNTPRLTTKGNGAARQK